MKTVILGQSYYNNWNILFMVKECEVLEENSNLKFGTNPSLGKISKILF